MTTNQIPVPAKLQAAAERVATRLPVAVVAQVLARYDAGGLPSRIAADLFIAESTVHRLRRLAGLPRNGTVGVDKLLPAAEAQRTAELYESGLTIAQVAERIGLTDTGVIHRLEAAGVTRRPTGYAPGSQPSGLPDGHVSTIEAARRSGMSHVTVHRRCRAGAVPGARLVERQGPGPAAVWAVPEAALPLRRQRPPRAKPAAQAAAPTAALEATGTRDTEWLPPVPFIQWVVASGLSAQELAGGDGPVARQLRRVLTGEQHLMPLGLADRILTRRGLMLADVWPDLDDAIAEATAEYRDRQRASLNAMRVAGGQTPIGMAA